MPVDSPESAGLCIARPLPTSADHTRTRGPERNGSGENNVTKRACSRPGCGVLVEAGQGRCPACRREAEQARGNATQRGYGRKHRTQFREQVLARDPICKLCRKTWATVADHWPKDRRQLEDEGLDPNDPAYGRGLCASCHGKHTAKAQPGGFLAR